MASSSSPTPTAGPSGSKLQENGESEKNRWVELSIWRWRYLVDVDEFAINQCGNQSWDGGGLADREDELDGQIC